MNCRLCGVATRERYRGRAPSICVDCRVEVGDRFAEKRLWRREFRSLNIVDRGRLMRDRMIEKYGVSL